MASKPTNPELWAKIQKLLKGDLKSFRHKDETIKGPRDGKGFKVFPSAYANQWGARLYKRLGGKWKTAASYLDRLDVLARTVARTDLVILSRQLLKKYFHDLGEFPIPKIEIVNNPKSKWLGLCKYKSSMLTNTTIQIQRRLISDEVALKKVLAHELIHHVDFIHHFRNGGAIQPFFSRGTGHGQFFHERAAKINSIEGENFVTEKSDDVDFMDKEYFILVKFANNRYSYAVTLRPSDLQKKIIQKYLENGARIVKSKTMRWAKGERIGKAFSVPTTPEGQKELKDLFDQGDSRISF